MHAAVEHLFQDLEERVVRNAEGQLTAVRIHEIWGKKRRCEHYLDTDGYRSLTRAETDRGEGGQKIASGPPCTENTTR